MKQLLKLSILILISVCLTQCSNDTLEEPMPLPIDDTMIAFSKDAGADPTQAANQDRITDNVWITRSNEGGQIYNAKTETVADKTNSPTGTRWAVGTVDNRDNLTFTPFREAVGLPKNVVGKDLVLHLMAEDIYIDVTFTEWTSGKAGSISYVRTKI